MSSKSLWSLKSTFHKLSDHACNQEILWKKREKQFRYGSVWLWLAVVKLKRWKMFLCILFEPKTNHRFEITSFFFFPCYVQYPIDYSHGHINFSHHHFLISYSPATFNMFHVTREVTLSARKLIPSKNNFRGITMGIGPIWGITSLIFILSWWTSLIEWPDWLKCSETGIGLFIWWWFRIVYPNCYLLNKTWPFKKTCEK